jgi:hypothetical protein
MYLCFLAEQEARAFKRAFMSYAHEDRVEVLRAAQLLNALRMRYFQDLLSQKPGDQWEKRLLSEIDQCDVFLLFWSKHARDSDWVIKEAEYALQLSKSQSLEHQIEIVPVLLEGPPPPLPPKSLEEIHFNDPIRYVIFAEETVSKIGFEKTQSTKSEVAPQSQRPIPENVFLAPPKIPSTLSSIAVRLKSIGPTVARFVGFTMTVFGVTAIIVEILRLSSR